MSQASAALLGALVLLSLGMADALDPGTREGDAQVVVTDAVASEVVVDGPDDLDDAPVVDTVPVDELAARASNWVEARDQLRAERLDEAVEVAETAKAREEFFEAMAANETTTAPPTTAAPTTAPPATAPPTTAPRPPATAPPTTTTAAPPTTVAPPEPEEASPDGGPTAEQWYQLRECESGNDYQAVSPSGTYRGAYQFSLATWDWVAGTRFPGLVGVDPIDATPAQQDAMAFALYDMQGAGAWPTCGSYLG